MKSKARSIDLWASILAFIVGACSVGPPPAEGVDSAVETRVAGTLAALAPRDSTEAPPATEPLGSETSTPSPVASPAGAVCEVVTRGLNLRYGPGTVYAPPLDILRSGDQLAPTARNANASWIEVQVLGTGRSGWVSAAEQFMRCDLALLSLPLGVVPPTPTPSVTPTPPVLVVGPIEGTVGGKVEDNQVRFEIAANDPAVGDQNGDGIEFVRFSILFEGETVFESADSIPRYCAISGDPDCDYPFPDPAEWPNGEAIQEGPHAVRATVYALNGLTQTVEAEFEIVFQVDSS
jgi:hypothetical protein